MSKFLKRKLRKPWGWASIAARDEDYAADWDQFREHSNYGGVVIHRGRAYTITVGAPPCPSVADVADQEFGQL